MSAKTDLNLLHLNSLRTHCSQESERFFAQQAYDPRFCYELFRRAFVHKNEYAWESLYDQYQDLVLSWIQRHSLFPGLGEEADYFMNRAFEKMWKGIPADNFAKFPNLKSLLRYLQMCTNAVLVDFARWKEQAHLWDRAAQTNNGEEALDPFATFVESTPPPELELANQQMREQLWAKLKELCNSEKEEWAIHGSFVQGLKPREVFAVYEAHFTSVQDVSRTKDNFLARMRRNDDFRQFLEDA